MSIGPILQTGGPFPQDKTSPAPIKVVRAEFGDVTRANTDAPYMRAPAPPAPRVDPLYLELEAVEPGATLQILVVNDPRIGWCDSESIRTVLTVDNLAMGSLQQLSLSNDRAKELGIAPGDVFEIRQVDAAGNASEPTRVYLRNDATQDPNFQAPAAKFLGDVRITTDAYEYVVAYAEDARRNRAKFDADVVGAEHRRVRSPAVTHAWFKPGTYTFQRYADGRDPVVHHDGFELHLDNPMDGSATLTGKLAVERKATVVLENKTSGKSFTGRADENGSFTLTVIANHHDVISIKVMDRSGRYQLLADFPFEPVPSPETACEAAGPSRAA